MPNVDYSDVDKLMTEQKQILDDQQKLQDQIVDTSTEQTVNRLNVQKEEQQKEAEKEASGLYTNYKKQSSQFGVNQEQLVEQGLGNSGYAESSKVDMYNAYQRNVTEVMNTNNKLKAEIDLNITEAYQNADIQKAQNQLALYQQKADLLMNEYTIRYQKYRDAVSDEQWEKSYTLQRDQFEYQKQRDAVSDSQWERQYQMSLKSSRQGR